MGKMFFTEEDRKYLKEAVMNEENIKGFFEATRQSLTKTEQQAELGLSENKGNPLAEAIAHNNKVAASNLNIVIDLLEATLINVIEQRQHMSQLVEAYLSSEEEKKKQMKGLQKTLQQQSDEMQELAKHKNVLKWIEEYVKRSSETSRE